jgi:hypothetical protein
MSGLCRIVADPVRYAKGVASIVWRGMVQPTATTRFQLNQFFADTQKAEGLAAYKADPSTYLNRYALETELRAAIERKDIAAMYQAGANPYLLRFFCVNMGVSEPDYLSALHAMKEDRDG